MLAAVRRIDDVALLQLELGEGSEVTQCDVREALQVERLFSLADERFGRVDGLVNNAATIQPIGRIPDVPAGEWKQALLANLYGPYLCIAAALPRMVSRRHGVIVNISSGAAYRPIEGWSAYCSTKAGLAMLTRAVHEEYRSQGISVVGLAPGLVDTGMQAAIRQSGINPVSRLDPASLSSAKVPAGIIVRLLEGVAETYAGQEVDARDETFQQACKV